MTREQQLDLLNERLPDIEELLELRGCSCRLIDYPQCGACSGPLTMEEAEALGWIERIPK